MLRVCAYGFESMGPVDPCFVLVIVAYVSVNEVCEGSMYNFDEDRLSHPIFGQYMFWITC